MKQNTSGAKRERSEAKPRTMGRVPIPVNTMTIRKKDKSKGSSSAQFPLQGNVVELKRVGGLHHVQAAAHN